MLEIKQPVFKYLGVDGEHHLFKIYFPAIEKSADKFNFILDNGNNAENCVGGYGIILRLRPEDLLFYSRDAQFVQIEFKNNTVKNYSSRHL